ncbi:M48 family metalloprotease [Psychrobium sp. 1_MG-2023]|uniref:M48 family metalloprotease n=1 Tax=Psychrobium sp. 1_MG-2023 TaxID=3062624 RepID=UPI000C34BD91|nr:M48 family metalloprotease [Psychrobium sp. 1_MG-2023]MDP2562585.1 M48 family metalloprotease [Psychrobium sp. 1_MG-2023]PKF59648.1 peptidase M48 [Alteromonadales bacterium alter-6D02]
MFVLIKPYHWLIVVTFLILSGCSVNPATGSIDLVMMSESEEIKLGKEMHQKLIKSVPIYQDEKLATYIDNIGQKVAKSSHRPNIKYHFTIIDKPDINAFALPGGYIYINRGLLAYLDSEAQLAAVLAHEIGHITARHVVRQDTARKGANVLSVLSVFTTGNAHISDVTRLWSSAAVKGYGREMELEADGFGAEYLFNSGYDPHAMVETIGVLKDHERFARYRAKSEGKQSRSYHGVFSTHPRNDVRLKEVISKAGTLDNKDDFIQNQQQYREHIEGLVYGVNYEAIIKQQKHSDENRYSHKNLGFTLVFPKEWQVKNTRQAILSQPSDQSAQLTIQVAKHQNKLSPSNYLRKIAKTEVLHRSEDFSQYGLNGHTGIITSNSGEEDQRIAVLFQGRRAYVLTGSVFKPQADTDYDKLFLESIHSFRPQRSQRSKPKSKKIHYVKANAHTSIDALAKHLKIGAYPAQKIRLINGLYPRGEPKLGEWIKIIE